MSSSLATALDRLPKVELHCHVEGTMRAETLIDLAKTTASICRRSTPRSCTATTRSTGS